jgi:hypothetical protein
LQAVTRPSICGQSCSGFSELESADLPCIRRGSHRQMLMSKAGEGRRSAPPWATQVRGPLATYQGPMPAEHGLRLY